MKKILLVTHHDLSDPGVISGLLHSKYLTCNINYKNLPLLKLGDIKEYSAIIIFGGKMSANSKSCLLYTSPSPRDGLLSRMPSSA